MFVEKINAKMDYTSIVTCNVTLIFHDLMSCFPNGTQLSLIKMKKL